MIRVRDPKSAFDHVSEHLKAMRTTNTNRSSLPTLYFGGEENQKARSCQFNGCLKVVRIVQKANVPFLLVQLGTERWIKQIKLKIK